MTREAFIKVLKGKRYSYKAEGNKVVVNHYYGNVDLDDLTSLPPGVEFRNEGSVRLMSLTSLPSGVVFENRDNVVLSFLTSLPSDAEFRNGAGVFLSSLSSIPPGVEFNNGSNIYLEFLTGGLFSDWEGNIEGVDSKRLLNKMISLGLFER